MFPQPQEPTDEAKIKNWTISQIKTGLKLDNNGYNTIYTVLEEELRKEELLGLKLNTVARKKKLEKVLENIVKEYPALLHSNLSKKTERLCLEAFARRCNNNQRRRLKETNPSPLANSDSGTTPNTCLTSLHPRPPSPQPHFPRSHSTRLPVADNLLGKTAIFVQRNPGGQHTIYEPQDLIMEDKEIEAISINDLQFDIFVDMLREEMGYNEAVDTIIYRFPDQKAVEIKSQRPWRVALREMFWAGWSRFTFDIEQSGAKEQQRSCMNIQNMLDCDRMWQLIIHPALKSEFSKPQRKRKHRAITTNKTRKQLRGSKH